MVAVPNDKSAPPPGIDPAKLYSADELRRLWGSGPDLAGDMERAGFKWQRVSWRRRMRFALGKDLIAFIMGVKKR